MQLGLGLGLQKNRLLKFIPSKTDSVCYLTGDTYEVEGTKYYTNEVDVDIPVISGTGLDEILDFSVLNDDRFDKSNTTYWGSTLDDYFYYDAANPYHSKLKDFHYYYTEAQFTGLDSYNTMFLKAKATSNTSNEIVSVSGLVVYSTSLVDSKLTKTLGWIGIQDIFYGESTLDEDKGSFENGTDIYGTYGNNTVEIITGGAYLGEKYLKVTYVDNSTSFVYYSSQNGEILSEEKYCIEFAYKINDSTAYIRMSNGLDILTIVPTSEVIRDENWHFVRYEFTGQETLSTIRLYMSIMSDKYVAIDAIAFKRVYENYYKK